MVGKLWIEKTRGLLVVDKFIEITMEESIFYI
jgi:hypothetical protein